MFNLRYHIASLVSVFIALALGLVLGGLIVQGGKLEDQRAALIQSLRKEFAALREDNQAMKAESDQNAALSSALVNAYVGGRLSGRTIVVMANPGKTEGLASVRTYVEDAGGTVAEIRMLKPRFGLTDAKTRSAVASLAADQARPVESIATSLAIEWFSRTPERPLTQALVKAGVLEVTGFDTGNAAAGVVGLAMFAGAPDTGALAILEWASEARVPAVGAQTKGLTNGPAPAADARGASALDSVGTSLGEYSLVTLLGGGKPGYYGFAKGADALFPDPLE